MTGAWSRRLCASALALAVSAGPSVANAQTDSQRAAARTFATDGLSAYNAGHYEKAVDLFTRAEALVHAPPHLLYTARASAKLGKLVHAKEMYVKITREELGSSAPKAFVEAQKEAVAELAAIEPRLAKLTIVVAGAGGPSAKVTLDGVEVPSALISEPEPADPGDHTLRATADGYLPATTTVHLAERGNETATLTIDRAAPVAVAKVAPAEKPLSTARKAAPWIGFGVGVAGLAVGTIFMLKNRGDRGDADDICVGGHCPVARKREITDLDDSANSAQTISWIGYGVGAAGIIAGAVFLVLNRNAGEKNRTTGARVMPWMTASSGGLAGQF